MAAVTLNVYLPDYRAEVTLTLPDVLTSTEVSLLRMLIQGMGVSEIARRRCRSMKTVSYQKSQIYRKLGIRNDMTFWLDSLLRYKPVLKKTGTFMNSRAG
ncbi:LuxR C-terminal-related transcriptional regulator [Escherichia marmotae]|uniref:helix-turn-helix domain-containing protein n=1 Tax=Escherichia marmotae TaxID=1499973 RepID=UPI0023B2B173|nr:LuxR C-terminal-related transcriptional regulator [Escherichia marmotae]MDE9782918.1 LuxR C-terminal-related transcriptional regulator [Escherichia marmotae]